MKFLILLLFFLLGGLILVVGCGEIKNEIENTRTTPESNPQSFLEEVNLPVTCNQKAEKLIPKHLVISSNGFTQFENMFDDGTLMKLKRGRYDLSSDTDPVLIRAGSSTGENVNYFYLDRGNVHYSKQIVDEKGNILGTRSFDFNPVLKYSDINLNITLRLVRGGFNKVSWSGFTKEFKDIMHTQEIRFVVSNHPLSNYAVYANEAFEGNSGEIDLSFNWLGYNDVFKMDYLTGRSGDSYLGNSNKILKINPDILDNKIYDVVDYDITNCEWIADDILIGKNKTTETPNFEIQATTEITENNITEFVRNYISDLEPNYQKLNYYIVKRNGIWESTVMDESSKLRYTFKIDNNLKVIEWCNYGGGGSLCQK